MAETTSPLLTALPPATDYISYLTIIEQYLTEDTLPLLHKVLQDEQLTTNIGWDLVHVLVPMLPASRECLHDIARLGNPREVILKVTEALRLIEHNADNIEDGDIEKKPGTTSDQDSTPLQITQFITLLSMLSILHSRIRTKYPSRFLSTTLQAVLASFSDASQYREVLIPCIVQMVKKLRGIQRPALPSRSSSATLSRIATGETTTPAAKDPEATTEHKEPAEEAIQLKLYQAFVTHVFEEYLLNLTSHENVPGLAWCTRLMEIMHPERVIPHHKTLSSRFQEEGVLHDRNEAIGTLVSLAHDLGISNSALLEAISAKESMPERDDDEPPSSSADIPLSKTGSTMLYAARQVSDVLYGRQQEKSDFAIFPDHQALMNGSLSAASAAMGTIGTEPDALIDACLVLGLLALERDEIGAPSSDDKFMEYMQMSSLLASNCPNANLRGHAHYLVTTVLRSHPDEKIRFDFIKDTLEHCPFENLKTTAVGWIKGEILESNLAPQDTGASTAPSMFKSSIALDSLSPYLFPSLEADLILAPAKAAWMTLQVNLSFYLAVLNFLYLLVSASQLRHNLEIQDLWKDNDIGGSFIQPLRDAVKRFSVSIEAGDDAIGYSNEAEKQQFKAELNVIAETLERTTEAAKLLNAT